MEDAVKTAIADSVKEGNAEVKGIVEGLSTKVKALEDAKIEAKKVNIIIPEVYKGYKVSKQMEGLRHHYKDQNVADKVAKMILDVASGVSLSKAAADQNETTAADGGYLVLDAFDDMITKTAREQSVLMPLVNNKSVSRTDTFKFPSQLANVSLAWDAEGTVTNTSATYAETSIAIKRLSGYLSISNELLMDSAYDITGDISEQFSYAMGQEMDNQILNGTGSPCSGVLTAAAGYSVVLGTGLDNFSNVTADDYSLAISKLTTVDSANATYVLGKLAAHYVRTLKDSNNAPIYQEIAGSTPGTIYGIPQVTANNITDTSAASTAFAVLGDFKQFYLINRLGQMELMVDPYSDSVSYNTRFIWATRKGLGIRRSTGFVRMLTAA